MYEKFSRIGLKQSASALNNNLSYVAESCDKYSFAVIHKHLVNIVSYGSKEPECRQVGFKSISDSAKSYQPFLCQVRWVTLSEKTLFVIISQIGIQIFDITGTTLLYWHSFLSPDVDTCEEIFGQGIAVISSSKLCVGTANGSVLIFQVPPEGEITFLEALKQHENSVSCLASHKAVLASGDDSGKVCIWKENDDFLEVIHVLQVSGNPCTTLSMWRDILVAGSAIGQLKIYDLSTGNLMNDIDAHARAITATDIAEDCGLVLSVSEDGFIHVWQLKQGNIPAVSHKFSENIPDCPLHGACFLGSSGSSFCVSGYDLNEIICYRM